MHGTVRGLFKVLGAVVMLTLLLSAWAAHELSQGPLSLSGLTPYIEQSLSHPEAGYRVKVGNTILNWNQGSHSLDIRALDIRLLDSNERPRATFPEMSVTLSGSALLRGKLVPRSVRLIHPTLHLVRDESGALSLGVGGIENEVAPPLEAAPTDEADASGGMLDALIEPPGKETIAGQLQRVQVTGGHLAIEDKVRGIAWTAPNADFTFRRDERGLALQANLDLDLEGQQGHIIADGFYLTRERVLDLSLSGGGIKPASVTKMAPQLDFLTAVQVPIGGSARMRYSIGKGLLSLQADIAAGAGLFDLTPTAGFGLPVQSVRLRVDYQDDRFKLDELRVDLGGAVLTATGSAESVGGAMRIGVQAQIDGIPLDHLAAIWPKALAPNPRQWVTTNMTHGAINGIAVTLQAHVSAGKSFSDLSLDGMNGAMSLEDATLRYMPEMPPIQHLAAAVTFDSDAFRIDLTGGGAANLAVPEGRVVLSGLSKSEQEADISTRITGSLADILRFIDNPPLGYTRKIGIDPSAVKGDGVVDLSLRFPLVDALTLDKLKVKVEADAKGVALPKVVQRLDLDDGALHLSIDNDGMDASGPATIDRHPAILRWRENFADNAPFRSRYVVSGQLSDEGRKLVGLDATPFQPPYLFGTLPVDVTATSYGGGRYDIAVRTDLTTAVVTMPGLNFVKPVGMAAEATAEIQLMDGQLARVPKFHLGGRGLDVTGDVAFDKGAVSKVTLSNAAFARTQLAGSITFRGDGGLNIAAEGSSFDAREIVHDRPTDPNTDKKPTTPPPQVTHEHPDPRPEVTPLTISGRFGRVWLSDEGWMSNAAADLVRDHYDWRSIHVVGEVGDHAPLKFDLVPKDESHTALTATSTDAGAVLRATDIFDNVVGGQLDIEAVYDDGKLSRPLSGTLRVKEFQLAKAPVLARFLTVAGLTGILDLLSGQGIHFNQLDMPFTYEDGQLDIKDGQASGSALGFTAKGRIDLDTDKLGLEGTVVPAYALNAALGSLPLVGGIFSAEKGGGIIAMNYQMKGKMGEPEFTVNPLSALTPGFLRGLFHLFDEKKPPAQPSGEPHK